jgi:hypothetical protein
MPPAQAEAALKKLNPRLPVTSAKENFKFLPSPTLVALVSRAPDFSPEFDNVTAYFSMHPAAPRVTAIFRYAEWPQGQERSVKSVLAAMEPLLGQPPVTPNMGEGRDYYIWAWDAAGRPYSLQQFGGAVGVNRFRDCFKEMTPSREPEPAHAASGRPMLLLGSQSLFQGAPLCAQTSAAILLQFEGFGKDLTRTMQVTALAMKDEFTSLQATNQVQRRAQLQVDSAARASAAGRSIKRERRVVIRGGPAGGRYSTVRRPDAIHRGVEGGSGAGISSVGWPVGQQDDARVSLRSRTRHAGTRATT